jgi:hypothetical protein
VAFFTAELVSIPSKIKIKSRKRLVRTLAKETSAEKERKRQVLLDVFVKEGLRPLKQMLKIVENDEALADIVTDDKVRIVLQKDHMFPVAKVIDDDGAMLVVREDRIIPLLQAGVLRKSAKSIDIVPEMRDVLSDLVIQLAKLGKDKEAAKVTGLNKS